MEILQPNDAMTYTHLEFLKSFACSWANVLPNQAFYVLWMIVNCVQLRNFKQMLANWYLYNICFGKILLKGPAEIWEF